MYINYAFSTVNLMYTTQLWYGGAYIAVSEGPRGAIRGMRKFDEGEDGWKGGGMCISAGAGETLFSTARSKPERRGWDSQEGGSRCCDEGAEPRRSSMPHRLLLRSQLYCEERALERLPAGGRKKMKAAAENLP